MLPTCSLDWCASDLPLARDIHDMRLMLVWREPASDTGPRREKRLRTRARVSAMAGLSGAGTMGALRSRAHAPRLRRRGAIYKRAWG